MVFHVINFKNDQLNSLMYSLKTVAQGRPSKPPHITVRGPFDGVDDSLPILNEKLRGNTGVLTGIDSFQAADRTVVFLSCNSVGLAKVWFKPSFPQEQHGIRAHVTIYEGTDKGFADSLLDIGRRNGKLNVRFDASQLELFRTDSDFSNEQRKAISIASEMIEEPRLRTTISDLSIIARLEIMAKLFEQMERLSEFDEKSMERGGRS